MKLINKSKSKISYGITPDGYLLISINHPNKWNANTQYRGGGSIHKDGEHFSIWIEEEDELFAHEEFCLVPENRDEVSMFERPNVAFNFICKEQEEILFYPPNSIITPFTEEISQ